MAQSQYAYHVLKDHFWNWNYRRGLPEPQVGCSDSRRHRSGGCAGQCDQAGCSDDEYLALAEEGPGLEVVVVVADAMRKDAAVEDATYVVNRNINFIKVCYTGRRFCTLRSARAMRIPQAAEQELPMPSGGCSSPSNRSTRKPTLTGCLTLSPWGSDTAYAWPAFSVQTTISYSSTSPQTTSTEAVSNS